MCYYIRLIKKIDELFYSACINLLHLTDHDWFILLFWYTLPMLYVWLWLLYSTRVRLIWLDILFKNWYNILLTSHFSIKTFVLFEIGIQFLFKIIYRISLIKIL